MHTSNVKFLVLSIFNYCCEKFVRNMTWKVVKLDGGKIVWEMLWFSLNQPFLKIVRYIQTERAEENYSPVFYFAALRALS